MKHLVKFNELNNYLSNEESNVYIKGDKKSVKLLLEKHLTKEQLENGGFVNIYGEIDGTLALESRFIDIIYFNGDVLDKISLSNEDGIKGNKSGWILSKKSDISIDNSLSEMIDDYIDNSGDYTDCFLVFFNNPDYKISNNVYKLKF